MFAGLLKNYSANFHNIYEKVAHEPQKKLLYFGVNLNDVTLGLGRDPGSGLELCEQFTLTETMIVMIVYK